VPEVLLTTLLDKHEVPLAQLRRDMPEALGHGVLLLRHQVLHAAFLNHFLGLRRQQVARISIARIKGMSFLRGEVLC
jgi:hypothetical protein